MAKAKFGGKQSKGTPPYSFKVKGAGPKLTKEEIGVADRVDEMLGNTEILFPHEVSNLEVEIDVRGKRIKFSGHWEYAAEGEWEEPPEEYRGPKKGHWSGPDPFSTDFRAIERSSRDDIEAAATKAGFDLSNLQVGVDLNEGWWEYDASFEATWK